MDKMQPTREEVFEFLEFLVKQSENKDLKSYTSIKNAINLFSIPFPSLTISKGAPLYRARVHKESDILYDYISDLSFVNDNFQIKNFGRANEPLQSIFYCSNNCYVSFYEVSKINNPNYLPDFEVTTVGKWIVQRDLRVANIPINFTIKGLNISLDGLQDKFDQLIKKFDQQGVDLTLNVLDVFSREFTRDAKNDETNYLISCAFANYLYDSIGYDTNLKTHIKSNGILYPSVKLTESGVNIAIKPEFILNNSIVLVHAVRRILKKVNHNEYSEIETKESKKIDYESGRIIW